MVEVRGLTTGRCELCGYEFDDGMTFVMVDAVKLYDSKIGHVYVKFKEGYCKDCYNEEPKH